MNSTFSSLKTQVEPVLSWGRQHKLRVVMYFGLGAIVLDLLYLILVGPSWDDLAKGPVPKSKLILAYEDLEGKPQLRWQPSEHPFPRSVQRVFIAAEDSRFYEHQGIDFTAIHDAVLYNFAHGKVQFGASTISQQTVKNIFLSPARTPWRKFNVGILTLWMEQRLEKNRILHLYLNVAEFGEGIFGLEAAARTYFKKSAYQLSLEEAIELAATLPSPVKNNPRTRTRQFLYRVARLTDVNVPP